MALLSTVRDLHRRKGRERRQLALAEGVRLVEEMLRAAVPCKGALVSPSLRHTPRGEAVQAALAQRGIAVEELSDDELSRAASTEHPQGVIAVYTPREWSLEDLRPQPHRPLVVLDAVQDPGNVGTIARTALALGASGLFALPGTADLVNPKTVRGAMGALFQLPHCAGDEATLNQYLDAGQIPRWVLAMNGDDIADVRFDRPVALVLGNEAAGVRDALRATAQRVVTIPIAASAESLNVAAAAAIALYLARR